MKTFSLRVLTLISIILSGCGPADRANNNLEAMNQNMQIMQTQMAELTAQGQRLTNEATQIGASFQELVATISSMSAFMQEITSMALTLLLPPAGLTRPTVVVPTADDVFDSLEEETPVPTPTQIPISLPTEETQP